MFPHASPIPPFHHAPPSQRIFANVQPADAVLVRYFDKRQVPQKQWLTVVSVSRVDHRLAYDCVDERDVQHLVAHSEVWDWRHGGMSPLTKFVDAFFEKFFG